MFLIQVPGMSWVLVCQLADERPIGKDRWWVKSIAPDVLTAEQVGGAQFTF